MTFNNGFNMFLSFYLKRNMREMGAKQSMGFRNIQHGKDCSLRYNHLPVVNTDLTDNSLPEGTSGL